MNFYNRYSRDQRQVYHAVLATRLYLLLLIISIWIVVLCSDTSNQINSEKIYEPSIKDYQSLEKTHLSTLVCPCTEMSIPYREIISIQAKYHQICSSDFIRAPWYQQFLFINQSNERLDFLSSTTSYFQTLTAFCHIANLTISDGISRFLSRNFLNAQLLASQAFHSQINSAINTFIQLTKIEFRSRMTFASAVIHSNQYLSYSKTSTVLESIYQFDNKTRLYNETVTKTTHAPGQNNSKCYCFYNVACNVDVLTVHPAVTISFSTQLPGIHGGCSVLSGVLKSSLVCWYDEECLKEFKTILSVAITWTSQSVTPLDPTLASQYQPDTPIEKLFNEMMVEDWNRSYEFAKFYDKCKPSFCLFTSEQKVNVIYMTTMLMSLLGGINIVLKRLSPLLIKIFFIIVDRLKKKRSSQVTTIQEEDDQTADICTRIQNLLDRLKKNLLALNLFENGLDDMATVRRQRISTRVYLLIFAMCICSITIYTMSLTRAEIVSMENPSEKDYDQLLKSASQLLECRCKQISVEYRSFLQMETRFHRICSSVFVGTEWRDSPLGDVDWHEYDRRDMRVRGRVYFSFLSTLCNLSRETVHNEIDQFLNEVFVSTRPISSAEFDMQINNTILQFQKNTVAKFSQSFQLLRDILNGNAFVSSYALNWYWQRAEDQNIDRVFAYPIRMTDGCSCATRSDCFESIGIYNRSGVQFSRLLGWNVGCSVVETLLHSTLECLYEQTCHGLLFRYGLPIGFSQQMDIFASSPSNLSRFARNTVVRSMADELFIEEWKTNISYSAFYNQCALASCSYQITRDDHLAYTISKLVGLFGGLTVTLRFSIPILINILFYASSRCRTATAVTPFH